MAIVPTRQQACLRMFLGLKSQAETNKKRQQDSVLSFRQKLGEPAPLASNPALQMKLNKAYRTYQRIILDIIRTHHEIEDLCQNQITFLDPIVDQIRTSQIEGANIRHILASFRSQMQPVEDQFAQLQRTLQVEEAAMILLANHQGRI